MIGENIKKFREKMGITQEKLANLMNLGKSTIGCYENNIRTPDIEKVKKMAEIFNCSTDELLGMDNWLEQFPEEVQELIREEALSGKPVYLGVIAKARKIGLSAKTIEEITKIFEQFSHNSH